MDLLEQFKSGINRDGLFSPKDKLLIAVSGGVDSVVLCELCNRAGFHFTILHCNFQLRGEESERDEVFVMELGKQYGVEVLVKTFDTGKYALETKKGIQEAARDLRYGWFKQIVTSMSAEVDSHKITGPAPFTSVFLLTAHHADDNIETVLMNFFRGTGLQGLEGIPVASDHIRRPLLSFRKEELIQFARENKLRFVEDSSNLSRKYTRNIFRNEIIPLIAKSFPQLTSNLQDNIHRFKEINKLYTLLVGDLKKKLCRIRNQEVHIPVTQLMSYRNRALIYEIIRDYGFTEKQVDEVIKLAESESGRFIQSPKAHFRIIKFRSWFIISANQSTQAETILIEKETRSCEWELGRLTIEEKKDRTIHIPQLPSSAVVDSDQVCFPLILRKWKQGDYFYPLGMPKKKKLSRFFIDQKLSKTEKEKIWVIEMNKKIIWVVGYRIDDRFKVTDRTKSVIKFSFERS